VGAGNVIGGGRPGGYRRRRPLPALLLVLALGLTAAVVWLRVFTGQDSAADATGCAPPISPPSTVSGQPPTTLGQSLGQEALDRTTPLPPALVQVRVVNGSTHKGQAAEITEGMRQLGFGQIAPPDNDPLYSALDLDCRAQIRFGPLGAAAARTVSLVEPCAQLVRDDRQDRTVDLALGNRFDDLRPRSDTRHVLEELNEWAAAHPEIDVQGGQASNPAVQPDIDPSRFAAARQVTCE
jgi:hypothetical protein